MVLLQIVVILANIIMGACLGALFFLYKMRKVIKKTRQMIDEVKIDGSEETMRSLDKINGRNEAIGELL